MFTLKERRRNHQLWWSTQDGHDIVKKQTFLSMPNVVVWLQKHQSRVMWGRLILCMGMTYGRVVVIYKNRYQSAQSVCATCQSATQKSSHVDTHFTTNVCPNGKERSIIQPAQYVGPHILPLDGSLIWFHRMWKYGTTIPIIASPNIRVYWRKVF